MELLYTFFFTVEQLSKKKFYYVDSLSTSVHDCNFLQLSLFNKLPVAGFIMAKLLHMSINSVIYSEITTNHSCMSGPTTSLTKTGMLVSSRSLPSGLSPSSSLSNLSNASSDNIFSSASSQHDVSELAMSSGCSSASSVRF